jgi:CheY-like chemotaxis protein
MGDNGVLTVTSDILVVDKPLFCLKKVVPFGKYVRIIIDDTGDGISDTDLQKVIEPFFTVNKKKNARGSGLGLSIVFSVIRDCNGYLILENHDNGFRVSVLIPFYSGIGEDAAEAVNDDTVDKLKLDRDSYQPRVLVVDDEEEIVNLFKLMLGAEIKNVNIDVARNGHEALSIFKERRHDVIVMDLHMPVMDGHEAFIKLTELCAADGIRMPGIVFCTGYIPPEGIRQAVSDNSHHRLLQKPITIQSLIDAVKERLPA